MKVTLVPVQIVVADAEILTAGTTLELTVIVMLLDVAVVGTAQLALEVITQLITSPLARDALV